MQGRWKSVGMTALGMALATLVAAGLAPAQTTMPGGVSAITSPAGKVMVVNGKPFTTEARREITALPEAPVTPRTPADLKAIQARVEAVVKLALPATVGILMSDGQGSGVIVSKDGYVLTAGHVSGKPGADVDVVLSNGVVVKGKAMGANTKVDSGMVKITTPGEYPFMPVGAVSEAVTGGVKVKVALGQWVVAMGHPGGYQRSRPPVARLGRILMVQKSGSGVTAVATDCPLINGDSGGPVFDLDGRVIGINSRIGVSLAQNLHVPIDTFTETWDRLAKGDQWPSGGFFVRRSERSGGAGGAEAPEAVVLTPRLGVKPEDDAKGVVIALVYAGSAAELAGLKKGDVVTKFDGRAVKTADELTELVRQHKAGDTVTLDLMRSAESKRVSVKLGVE